jgi:hypothetical protein
MATARKLEQAAADPLSRGAAKPTQPISLKPGRWLPRSCTERRNKWGRVLAERARNGTTGPVPVPHPDDVIIDYETGKVRFDGPIDEEQKTAQEWARANSPDVVRRLMQINEQIESDPKNLETAQATNDLKKFADWLYDDAMKQAVKRGTRDAPRRTRGKSSMD